MCRVEFPNSRGLTLVGNYRKVAHAPTIIMVHGLGSDRSAGGRFDRLAEALSQNGYSTLAFDLGSCGESSFDTFTLEKFRDDLQCAIAFAKSNKCTSIGLVGHSLGAVTCLQVFPADIEAMVLTGAVAGALDFELGPEDEDEVKKTGHFTVLFFQSNDEPLTRKADAQIIRECALLTPQNLFAHVSCPTLLIYAANDSWISQAVLGIRHIKAPSQLEMIEGTDHNLYSQYERVINLAVDWFRRYIPSNVRRARLV